MDIKLIDYNNLEVFLTGKDLNKHSLDFDSLDYSNMETRLLVWEILDEVNKKTGVDFFGEKILIEASEQEMGCLLHLTLVNPMVKNKEKILCFTEPVIYQFQSADNLLSAVANIRHYDNTIFQSSSLYLDKNKYDLVFVIESSFKKDVEKTFSEYGLLKGRGNIAASAIDEHYKKISGDNAINEMHKHLA